MMNPEIKEQWVKALRSGEYKQAIGCLFRNKGENDKSFCCLGVLTDLYIKAHPDKAEWISAKQQHALAFDVSDGIMAFHPKEQGAVQPSFNSGCMVTPDEVVKWSGISTSNGSFQPDDKQYTELLSDINDGGKTFSEIADLIEKYF